MVAEDIKLCGLGPADGRSELAIYIVEVKGTKAE